ncbi:MAG: hypothetical protein Q9203_002469 [Teloschistes exilis]
MSTFVAIESGSHFSQSKVKFEFIPGLLLLERPVVHADQQIFYLEHVPCFSQSKTELSAQRTPTVDEEFELVTVKLPSIRRRRNHSLLPFDEEDGTHFSQSKTDVVESFDEMIWDDDGVEMERIIHVRLPFAAGETRSLFFVRDDTLLEGWNNINISTHIPMATENSPITSVDLERRDEDRRPLTAYERLGPKGRWNEEHYVGTGESLTYGTSFIKSMTKEREEIRAVLSSSGLPVQYWWDQWEHLSSLQWMVAPPTQARVVGTRGIIAEEMSGIVESTKSILSVFKSHKHRVSQMGRFGYIQPGIGEVVEPSSEFMLRQSSSCSSVLVNYCE